MNTDTKGTVVHLYGELTHSGATQSIEKTLAASLEIVEYVGDKSLRIDCKKVVTADFSGLQLLYKWMQGAKDRGVEPKLVNLSNSLQQDMQNMGIGKCFSRFNASLATA